MKQELEWPSDEDEDGFNDEVYGQSQTSSHGYNQQNELEIDDNPSRV